MKKYIHTINETEGDDVLCMSIARGDKMTNPGKQPFSFYFSGKNSSHGIRVKPVFNPGRLIINKTGILKLCGDWAYIPGEDDKHIKSSAVRKMK